MSIPQWAGDPQARSHLGVHGRLAGQRVTEGLQEAQVPVVASFNSQSPHQGRYQQPGHPPAEPSFGHSVVVALGEGVAEARVGHRVHQAGRQLAAVARDVGVVHGDHRSGPGRQHGSEAVPHVAALAPAARGQPQVPQPLLDRDHGRAVVPQHVAALRQPLQQAAGPPAVGLAGLVEAHHDVGQPVGASQFADHHVEGLGAHIGRQAGDYQRHRPVGGPGPQIALEIGGVAVAQVVQRRHDACLAEVGHARQCRTARASSHPGGANPPG